MCSQSAPAETALHCIALARSCRRPSSSWHGQDLARSSGGREMKKLKEGARGEIIWLFYMAPDEHIMTPNEPIISSSVSRRTDWMGARCPNCQVLAEVGGGSTRAVRYRSRAPGEYSLYYCACAPLRAVAAFLLSCVLSCCPCPSAVVQTY